MSDETYNGWKNYQTWAVGMFLDGNYDGPGTYYGTIETVRDAIEDVELTGPRSEYWTAEESTLYAVADSLKDYVEELTNPHMDRRRPPSAAGRLVADLFGAALQSVDWNELAEAWIENVGEQVNA